MTRGTRPPGTAPARGVRREPGRDHRSVSAHSRIAADRRAAASTSRRTELAADSLAHVLVAAGGLVAAVIAGQNLTDAFENLQRAHPLWTDGVRGAVRDHAWETLRDYGRGDRILAQLLAKPLPAEVHAILLVALHRLETRPGQAHTIVDQAVEAVASFAPGLRGVANGVLRSAIRQSATLQQHLEADEVTHYRHPAWWIARVRREYPDSWEPILEAGNQKPPMSLRVNTRRTTVEAVEDKLVAMSMDSVRLPNGALLLARPVPVSRLPGFAEGMLSVQDAGAQWAAHWLDLAAGQRVLDACAAPGGKAAHILEREDVQLTALELDPQRARRISDNFRRLGLEGRVVVGDARRPEQWWDGRPFDRILADVPCSASGVVRRHPDIKWLRRARDISGFAARQRELLDALWHTLAPGGKMLYVTCSVFLEENAQQVEEFCRRQDDAERIALDGQSELRLLPAAEHDGFYYALLRKRR